MSAGGKPFCPDCGKAATGNFCQHCGAKLGGRFCNHCGSKVAPAAAFCNQCGTKVEGGGASRGAAAASVIGGQNLPWWIAGVAMFVLIVVVGVRMVQTGPAAPPVATADCSMSGGPPPNIAGMTPQEAADRLFDRVMRCVEAGDSASAQAFLPMAIAAYDRAQPLDNDGLFHLAMLNRTAMNLDAALATAEQILATEQNHILGLSEAAEASIELGRVDEAAAYYQRLLDAYPVESARPLPEYQGHSGLLEASRSAAQAFLAAR
jgi:hypothetical protein